MNYEQIPRALAMPYDVVLGWFLMVRSGCFVGVIKFLLVTILLTSAVFY